MNSVCITGYLSRDLSLVEEILNQAGMQAALPAEGDSSMSISVWHQKVASLLAKDISDANGETDSPLNLGRFWEQLASDIFISNLNSQTWGWADTLSGSLLPFWKNFDPQLRFVLVVCSPERMIAHAIESSGDNPNVELILKQWQSYTETLLAFYKENPKRSIVVNVQDCIDLPAIFLQTLNKKWDLKLNKVHFPNITDVGFSDITRYLAAWLVRASTTHQGLSDNFLKSVTLNSSGSRIDVTPSHAELMQWYRKIQDDFLQRGKDQLAFQVKHNKLAERLDQERSTSAELSAQNFRLERKQKELTIEIKSLRDDLVLLKHSNNILQEELKNIKDINAQFDKSIEVYGQQQAQLTEARYQLSDLTVKLSTANALVNTYASEVKDLREEGELLLLQLHQVQEELETYFLKYQEATEEVESVQARWRRMLVRNPDYCDAESIEIEPVVQYKTLRATWRIKGMDAVGRHIPEISFVTFVENGIAGFEFSRANNGSTGLLRWPATLAKDNSLNIAIGGDTKASEQRALAIIGLATTDWSLIFVLIGLLRKALLLPSVLKLPQNFDSIGLIKAFDKLEISLQALPEVLRYDKVKLKREQVNPDYEHLWFAFENMKASGKLIGDFEYRISCTNVQPKKFGNYPKLEFPQETCKTVIQSWFDESYDDYGAKLELRFARPDSMDIGVWDKLTACDQAFVLDLIRQLPYVLDDLHQSGNTVKRGWDDWKILVTETQRILNMRAEPSKPTLVKRQARKRDVWNRVY